MTRIEYREYRTLIRENGRFALRWMPPRIRTAFEALIEGQDAEDPLEQRKAVLQDFADEGIRCTPRQIHSFAH